MVRERDTAAGRRDRTVGRWEQRFDRTVLSLGRTFWGRSGRGQARGLLRVFRFAERLTERGRVIVPLSAYGVARYEIAPLPTAALPMRDGSTVERGETVIILHFDNKAIAALDGGRDTRALTWHMIRAGREGLRQLAALAGAGAFPDDVRAVWAETLFYPALARLGLETRPARRTLRRPFARLFMLAMLAIYGREGPAGVDVAHLPLGEAWIALDDLRRRMARD